MFLTQNENLFNKVQEWYLTQHTFKTTPQYSLYSETLCVVCIQRVKRLMLEREKRLMLERVKRLMLERVKRLMLERGSYNLPWELRIT